MEQTKNKHSEAAVKLNELKSKAQTERNNQLKNIDSEIDNAAENAKNAELEVGQLEEKQNKVIKTKEKERDKIIDAENDHKNNLLLDIEAEIKVKKSEIEKQKEEVCNRKNKELSEKGADTKRLNEIEIKLQSIIADFKFIEDNRDLVAEYRKDKREFIDKTDEFKQEKQKFEKQEEYKM